MTQSAILQAILLGTTRLPLGNMPLPQAERFLTHMAQSAISQEISSVTTLLGNMPMAERFITQLAQSAILRAILLGTMRLPLGNMPLPMAVRLLMRA